MEKINYIEQVINSNTGWERDTRISSLIFCLTSEEACEFLDLKFFQEFNIRRKILRKIGQDIVHNIQQCHYRLIERLIDACNELPSKRNSCAYCLDYLYPYLPEETQPRVLGFFIKSKYIGMRRRAYKKLERNWSSDYQSLVNDIWQKYKDAECASLISRYFPLKYLQEHFAELEEALFKAGPRNLVKLFLRVVEDDVRKLDRLAQLDEITFAYVSTKLNYPFTVEQAFQIFENNKFDERVGLLIWCFGQMGLWSVLVNISNQAKELEKEHLARFLSKVHQPSIASG